MGVWLRTSPKKMFKFRVSKMPFPVFSARSFQKINKDNNAVVS